MTQGGKIPRSAGSCDFCGSQIPVPDFQEGRASVVSDRLCCAGCLESGAWVGSAKKPRGAEPICRGQSRFVPTTHLDLTLRLPGWRGLLFGNLAEQWLDVSAEGFRAVVGRRCAVGDLLMARVAHRSRKEHHEIISTVRHVQESRKFPGCVLAGFLFVNPTPEFRDMLRAIYGVDGILDPPVRETGKKSKKLG